MIIFVIWMLSAGVASLPLTGLIGQYGYHPNHGCNLLRCNNSLSGSKVPFYFIYIMGYFVPYTVTLIISILIFKEFFSYCISNPSFWINRSQKINLKDHFIFAVFIILYTCCSLILTCFESFASTLSVSTDGYIVIGVCLILWYLLILYIHMYILMSPKCKEILLFLFRDINSVVNNSKSISMSNFDGENNVSKCRVNSLE